MAVDFIKKRIGSADLNVARQQQRDINYFVQSDTQHDVTEEYIEAWAERNYRGNDVFLNWIKTLLRTDNFLTYFKYHRKPLPSAKIINDKIKPQLSRVFFAEDAHFKYIINGDETEKPEELDCDHFKQTLFDALLFRFNDIIIEDLKGVNDPFREIISIDKVVAIDSHDSTINKIAFRGKATIADELGNMKTVKGFVYMDSFVFAFYDEEYNLLIENEHDLNRCPADYISSEPLTTECDVVRKSIFSYVKNDFEEYCFLKTLQRMTEPNGAIPVITMIKSKKKTNDSVGKAMSSDKEPMTAREITGQHSEEFAKTVSASKSAVQTGSIIEVPALKLDSGALDMDAVKNYINFFHHPVDAMEYLKNRIAEIEHEIEISLIGELADQTGERKNEKQVSAGFVSAQDKLRFFSMQMSRINQLSDWKFLALKYGPENVMVETFYGSDFFLESQGELYDLFEKSPNPIERKNILIRLTKNKGRFNTERTQREVLLYHLLPFASDKDFQTALDQQIVDFPTKQLQTRFNYWINMFESEFGDIVVFWNNLEISKSEKLILINNLLLTIINRATQPIEQPQNTQENEQAS